MKKKSSYRWLIWIILAVVLIGVALWNILPPYIDRWKSARDYDKLAEEYVNDESEPDDEKQKKRIDISDGAFHNDDSSSMQLTRVGE